MATRKLQTEIDKVLKKVAEGVETFEETLEKIETTTNANQKEKYESDLKKEIKKLQRQRDQIKTWISSSDIKDKRALMDNRKLIEQQMERFKAIEKEMKTKAYSREGLIMSGRMDPKEKEKAETCSWVTDKVEALNIQIEGLEAEVETLQAGAKKGKNNIKERILELEEKIERHKWHQGRLELIMRLLENGQIETDQIVSIQEDVNYYVDQNTDPDFAEDEEIYADLILEDDEYYFTVGAEDSHGNGKDDDNSEKSRDDYDPPVKKQTKDTDAESVSSPAKPTAVKPMPTKKPTISEQKEAIPMPGENATAVKVNVLNGSSSRQPTIARSGPTESPVIQYATAVAANLSTESFHSAVLTGSPKTGVALVKSPKITSTAATKTESPSFSSATALTPVASQNKPQVPSTTSLSSTAAIAAPNPASIVGMSGASAGISSAIPTAVKLPSYVEDSQHIDDVLSQSISAQPQPTLGPEIRLPSALADLANSFEVSKDRVASRNIGFFLQQMLETSYQFVPEAVDTERPKHYAPKTPYPTPAYYPQAPPTGLFENATMFEKFDIDTLFFIFYYQQGTYQQYLAARELKKQSWRFHKKYLTWFQRHEEPKAITDDYEQGTYIYFDYEGAWCQRKKTDFRFEYKFLEDAEL
ncbi:proteinral negative regulator of transcription subunit 5 [Mortierella sp. AM989]|nr:proteinral negative regulator of transcription subunit 5 [Mortierella sp. AM989]